MQIFAGLLRFVTRGEKENLGFHAQHFARVDA